MKFRGIALTVGFVIVAIVVFCIFGNGSNNRTVPKCENGVVDLSTWDFKIDGNIKLDGTWEFYPRELLTSSDIDKGITRSKLYVDVPKPWKNQLSSSVILDRGIGTYRLKVKTNGKIDTYGMKITNIRSSAKIFVNGKEILRSGNPAEAMDNGYISEITPVVGFFSSNSDTLDIIIQVANLDYYNGGIIQSIYLGSNKEMLDNYFKLNALDIMSTSFLALAGFCYLFIFIKIRKSRQPLYLSFYCLGYAFISATGNEKIFNKLFSFIPYFFIIRLRIAAISLTIYIISYFIRGISSDFLPKKYNKLIKITMIINIAVILAVPTTKWIFIENIIGIINILAYVLMGILIVNNIIKKNYGGLSKNQVIFLITIILLIILGYVNYILYFFSLINNNYIYMVTLLMLAVGISAMLLDKYTKAYSDLEIMTNNLIALDKTKDEFLVNTSHEFKTPLNAIINISQSILDRKEDKKYKSEDNLLYIISIAKRLANLVNDIIDFESLQSGKLKFDNTIFDINGVVQAVIDILSYMKKNEEIQLINEIPEGKYYVYADENRIKQIIYNLIDNSLKYTENGYVKISADRRDDYVFIKVTDTGLGIEEHMKNSIFQRYTNITTDNYKNIPSTGLGLSISKVLASNMGGDLYLQWSEPNKGSVFEIKIPEGDNEEGNKNKLDENRNEINEISEAYESIKTQVLEKSHKDIFKILIVDDESSNIKVLQEIFYEEEYECIVAYNGIEALELIKKRKDISMVLLDVMMPGMSGYKVCEKIRREYNMFQMPIILLTVRNSPEDIELGFKTGANDFLVKPFNYQEIKSRVKTIQKMKKSLEERLAIEMAFLQSQIKPHFLYNALSTIVSLCYINGERAGQLLGELSNYLRFTFDIDPYNSFITIKEEIDFVKTYVELEKARFGDRLKIEFHIDEDCLEHKIPALTIQPIVENSIRHGLMKRVSGGTVNVHINRKGNHIEIKIEDDGVGLSSEKIKKLLNNNAVNSGIRNVNRRFINEYGQGILIKSKESKGTIVKINIPTK